MSVPRTVLVTGAAHRIGRELIETFHALGSMVAIHYNTSKESAESLVDKLVKIRPQSAFAVQADLTDYDSIQAMMKTVLEKFDNKLSLLINNASTFYETPIETLSKAQVSDRIGLFMQFSCIFRRLI